MSREILYLRGRSEEHQELVALLEQHGFRVSVLRQLEEMAARHRSRGSAAVIIDASSDNAEVGERLVELLATPELKNALVLFIGKRVSERAYVAQQQFPRFLPVDYPFEAASFVNRFETAYSEEELPPAAAEAAPAPRVELRGGYGGSVLRLGKDLAAFDDEALIPSGSPHRDEIRRALGMITSYDFQLGIHARRTASISALVGARNGFSRAQDQAVRTSGLLLNLGFVEQKLTPPALEGLLRARSPEAEEIARAYLRSAQLVAQQIGDTEAAETIRTIADLIKGKADDAEAPLRRTAECVLLTEIADQLCWATGSWQMSGARKAVRMLRETELATDATARVGVAKAVTDAVLAEAPRVPLLAKPSTPEQRLGKRLAISEAMTSASARFKNSEVRTVKLLDLMPGMRLAEPLLSNEGEIILQAGTVLDLDILLRIFQLTAIRPLQGRIAIVKEGSR